MATEDMSKKDPVKLLEEQLKMLKQMLGKLDEQLKFQNKKDRATTPGSRWDRKHQRAYLESVKEGEKKRSTAERLQEKFQWEQRKTAYNQLKALNKAGTQLKTKSGKPDGRSEPMPQLGAFKKFNAQMKSVAQMINPKGVDKKKVASESANAMKGMMKFAVGGSIVGMLGKKLFDSSPLLKTMMSLFNTSIMLIFRPIGDFIGSFLRPIMLFFMKNIAIPFYKNSKHAMGLGEQYGKQALGFLLKPAETIHASIVTALADFGFAPLLGKETVNRAKDYDGMAHWQLDQLKAAGMDPSNQFDEAIGKHGWTHMKGMIQDVWTGGKEKQGGGQMWGTTPGATSTPGTPAAIVEEYFASVEGNAEASAQHMEDTRTLMGNILADGKIVEGEWDQLQELMDRAKLAGVDIKNSIFFIKDEMEKSGEALSNRWQAFKDSNINAGKGIHSTTVGTANDAINMWKSGIFSSATGTNFDINSGGIAKSALNPNTQSSAAKRADTTKMWNKSAGVPGVTQSFLERIKDSSTATGWKSKTEIEGIRKAMGFADTDFGRTSIGAAGSKILAEAQLAKTTGFLSDGRSIGTPNDKEARKHAAAYGAAMTLYNMVGGTKPQMGDLTNIINGKPAGSKGYAHGGLITEPIFGVGRSGQTYTFGERGQETVTPGKGGTSYTLNINVGNVTREADFDKLKPLIQRWILEANSRRGVV